MALLKQVQPVLPSQDVARAIEFYVERLGFKLAFKDAANPRYAAVTRDDVELHLQWHDASEWSRVERPMLRFVVSDIVFRTRIDRIQKYLNIGLPADKMVDSHSDFVGIGQSIVSATSKSKWGFGQ